MASGGKGGGFSRQAGEQMNTEEQLKLREQVSALADGQLHGVAFAATVEQLGGDEDGRASWHVYHLIGDVLRSSELGTCQHDRDFVARLSARLQAEPGVPRGLDGLQLASEPEFVVGPAESRWVPVRLQIPYGSASPGSHPLVIEIEATQGGAHVAEKSVFIVPR